MEGLYYIAIALIFFFLLSKNDGQPSNSFAKQNVGRAKIDAMLKYLRMRTPCSRRDFELPQELYNGLYSSGFSQNAVSKVVYKILEYLRVDASRLVVRVEYLNSSSNSTSSGTYQANNIGSIITIKISNQYSVDQVVSIICHECTHHFMRCKNLYATNEKDNEYLTDITALYLGFGNYLRRGYDTQVSQQVVDFGTINYQTTSMGYLNSDDIEYVIRKVNEIRRKAITLEKK